jgi:hypothetical protein
MMTSTPFDTKPKDLSFLDKFIAEKDAREQAEQRVMDFRRVAENWCTRAGEEHRDAMRNRRAFLLASLVSAIMTLAALVGWLR